jgi:hypothetical protein
MFTFSLKVESERDMTVLGRFYFTVMKLETLYYTWRMMGEFLKQIFKFLFPLSIVLKAFMYKAKKRIFLEKKQFLA